MTQVNLTDLEIQMLTLFAEESTQSCGNFCDDENLSYMNAHDLADEMDLSLQAIGGLMSGLQKKGFITNTEESARGSKHLDFIGEPEFYAEHDALNHLVTA